eukprot:gene10254-11956_t
MSAVTLTPEQISTIRVSFDKFDVDKNGTLDKVELRKVLEDTLKRKLTDHLFSMYLELQFNASDKDFNGVIDFNEFCSLYSKIHINPELPIHMGAKHGAQWKAALESGANAPKLEKQEAIQLNEAEIEEARAQFAKYDANKSGTIDRAELTLLLRETIAKRMGDMMMKRLVDGHMQLADKDGNDEIDFNEFIAVYKKILSASMPGMAAAPRK